MSRYNEDIVFFNCKFVIVNAQNSFTAYDIMQNI